MWKQHEVFDGTYNLDDLLDAHEVLAVTEENRKRSMDAQKMREGGI
jgi:hypothetical protein